MADFGKASPSAGKSVDQVSHSFSLIGVRRNRTPASTRLGVYTGTGTHPDPLTGTVS